MRFRNTRFGVMAMLLLSCGTIVAQETGAPAAISHGPMLGHVTSDSIRIWARTMRPAKLAVHYGLRQDSLDQVSETIRTPFQPLGRVRPL